MPDPGLGTRDKPIKKDNNNKIQSKKSALFASPLNTMRL